MDANLEQLEPTGGSAGAGGTAGDSGGTEPGSAGTGVAAGSGGSNSGGAMAGSGGDSVGNGGGGMAGASGGGAGGMSGGGAGGKAGSGGGGAGGAPAKTCGTGKLAITGATASSIENDTHPAAHAFDAKTDTRWASEQSEPQWIYVDLGEPAHVSRVLINWEVAFGTSYKLEIAQNANGPWTQIFQENASNGAMDDVTTLTPSSGRYVRMYGNTRATMYGFSIWELEVYGDLDETCK